MKDFIYTEKFDHYLKGKLSEDEKLRLEEAMQQDPLLKNEVNLQQDIFKALHDERKMLLKHRLDNVAVNSPTWMNLTGLQWAAILSSMLLLSAGVYYGLSDDLNQKQFPTIDLVNANNQQQLSDNVMLPEVPSPVINERETEESPDEVASLGTDTELVPHLPEQSATAVTTLPQDGSTPKSAIPVITRPDVLSDFAEDNQDINYSDFEAPDKALLEKSDNALSAITIETMTDTDYPFHYQMMDQKLYLYGDFKGIPYKIIALNHDQHRQLFLKYEGDYYMLNQRQLEIVPLEKINDSTIIRALKRLND